MVLALALRACTKTCRRALLSPTDRPLAVASYRTRFDGRRVSVQTHNRSRALARGRRVFRQPLGRLFGHAGAGDLMGEWLWKERDRRWRR